MKLCEIVYMPTLKCNYHCKHCGQDHRGTPKEMDIFNVLKRIKEFVKEPCTIAISGGEPFIKEGLEAFVLSLINEPKSHFTVGITTNGYFVEKIANLCQQVLYPERLSFSVSIDGTRAVHNEIRGNREAYDRAVETVRTISHYGIAVKINTVMQKENIPVLEEMRKRIAKMGNFVQFTPQPFISSLGSDHTFPYSAQEIGSIFPFIRTQADLKYLSSRGCACIQDCHAGTANIVIAPDGTVYPCVYSQAYMSDIERQGQYCMGDLEEQTFEELLSSKRRHTVLETMVKRCEGCQSVCDVEREYLLYNIQPVLTDEEAKFLLRSFKASDFQQNFLPDFSFGPVEYDEQGRRFYWMTQLSAAIWILPQVNKRILTLVYRNPLPDNPQENALQLRLEVQGNYFDAPCKSGLNYFLLRLDDAFLQTDLLKIQMHINHTWRPSEQFGGQDRRNLGIALLQAELEEEILGYGCFAAEDSKIQLAFIDLDFKLQVGQRTSLKVKINNQTKQYLYSMDQSCPIHVSYHIFDSSKECVKLFDGERTKLLPSIAPGEERIVDVFVDLTSQIITAGDILRVTLVQENRFWFDEIDPAIAIDLPICMKS